MRELSLFNEAKIILDLCGGTGAWSKPYKDAGYDVRLVTLPEQNVIDYIPPPSVWGILAGPPCTMFSLARTTAKTPRDFVEGMGPVNACVRIALNTQPHFFALENPLGLLSKWLGKPKHTFDPWFWGDPYTKKTALWGWFNPPKQQYFNIKDVITEEQLAKCKINNRDLPKVPAGIGSSQAAKRAITPAGFAKAFFEANP